MDVSLPLRWVWVSGFWALALATVVMSLVPGEQVPSGLVLWDKAQHALGFAALAVFGLQAYPHVALPVLAGLLLFGAGIEGAQSLTSWRQGDWLDWCADGVGVAAGYGLTWLYTRVRNMRAVAGSRST
jgi:VanZ family protein